VKFRSHVRSHLSNRAVFRSKSRTQFSFQNELSFENSRSWKQYASRIIVTFRWKFSSIEKSIFFRWKAKKSRKFWRKTFALLLHNTAWWIKNPDTKSFTWSQKSPRILCRLDYYLTSNNLFDMVRSTEIIPAIRTRPRHNLVRNWEARKWAKGSWILEITVPLKSKLPPSRETRVSSRETRLERAWKNCNCHRLNFSRDFHSLL